jgi:hypothetical protein
MTSAEHTEPVADRVDRHSTRDRSAQLWATASPNTRPALRSRGIESFWG